MLKSLGDYRIENSYSSDVDNIKWTHKKPSDTDKSKNKKKKADKRYQNFSASNIIHTRKTTKVKPPIEKVFKIEDIAVRKIGARLANLVIESPRFLKLLPPAQNMGQAKLGLDILRITFYKPSIERFRLLVFALDLQGARLLQ